MASNKAIVFADSHLRSDRLEIGKRFLQSVLIACKMQDANLVFCIGDLLHEKIGFTVDCLLMLNEQLKLFKEAEVEFFWIRGNHELPQSNLPTFTIMQLFSDTCHTIIEPRIYRTDTFVIYMLPWYSAQSFKTRAIHMARQTYRDQGKIRILMTHQGLNEGTVSASNTRVGSGVSVKDLYPMEYHWVLLGDYHHYQHLLENTFYLGCPYSHIHGDDTRNSIWMIDFTNNKLESLPLPLLFPKHVTFDVAEPGDFILPGYDINNYNRIRCHIDYSAQFREHFPSKMTTIDPWGRPTNKKGQERRIKTLDVDYNEVLQAFLKSKGYGALHYQFSREALEQASKVIGA